MAYTTLSIHEAVYTVAGSSTITCWKRAAATLTGVRVRLLLLAPRALHLLVFTASGLSGLSFMSCTIQIVMSYGIMGYLSFLWRKLTQNALEQSTGKLETAFFESVYRITYVSGLSLSDQGLIYQIYSNIIGFFIVLFVSSELWYLFSVSSSLDGIVDNINVTIIHLIIMYRYKSMMDNKYIYKELATSMESKFFDISTPTRQKILEFWLKHNEKYFKLLLTLGTCTLAVWYIYPLVDDVEYNFVAAVRLPFDYQTPGRYPATFAVVLLLFHYTSYFVIVNDLIMQAYLLHLLCQFAVLADCFENILSDCNVAFEGGYDENKLLLNERIQKKYTDRLGDLVEQHKFILKNALELRKILSVPMLGQLMASGMLICLAGYQVTATVTVNIAKFLMSLLYLAYNMYGFYIICRWCDEIKMQSESIREAVYCSGWERGAATLPGVRARLLLVTTRAARPLVLTAGGLYDLSLMSYTTLVKTSYSALTVLLRVRQRA